MEVGAGERSTNTKVVAALTKAAADGGELEEAVRDCTRLSSAQIHEAYVATVNGTRMLVALDNWAAESLIDISVDVSGMEVLTDDEMLILGVNGNGTKTGPLIKVPVENRKGAKLEFALCRRLDVFSRLGVKLVVAKLDQQRWEVDIKQGDNEFSLRVTDENGEAAREVIATASVAELTQRMTAEPMTVVVLCDGFGSYWLYLYNNGYMVEKYISVEIDPNWRRVLDSFGDNVDRSLGHDVTKITQEMIQQIDKCAVIWATPECQPWGGPQEHPPGFEDEERAEVFIASCEVVRWMREHQPDVIWTVETTAVSDKRGEVWKADQEMEQMYHIEGEFGEWQAADFGERHRRLRRLATNAEIMEKATGPSNPDDVLQVGFSAEFAPTPCVCASRDTVSPVMVMTRARPKLVRMVSINELERMFQLGTGATCAFGKVQMTLESRHRLVGNSVCSTHYRLVTACVPLPVLMSKKVMTMTVNEVHPQAFDLMLENIPEVDERDSAMIQFVLDRADGWRPPDMDFSCKGPSYHCPNAFPVDAKHEEAIMAKVQQFCKRKQFYIEAQDDFDPDCDYSPCFFKMKGPDRIDPETGFEETRLLCAMMVVNAKTELPAWLKEFSPNPEKYRSEFSEEDKCYTYIDERDAFQAVKASKNAQKHMKFVFKWKKQMITLCALVAVQGLALSALFYCLWKMLILRRILGWNVMRYYNIYMDDNIVKGLFEKMTRTRARLLIAIFVVFDI